VCVPIRIHSLVRTRQCLCRNPAPGILAPTLPRHDQSQAPPCRSLTSGRQVIITLGAALMLLPACSNQSNVTKAASAGIQPWAHLRPGQHERISRFRRQCGPSILDHQFPVQGNNSRLTQLEPSPTHSKRRQSTGATHLTDRCHPLGQLGPPVPPTRSGTLGQASTVRSHICGLAALSPLLSEPRGGGDQSQGPSAAVDHSEHSSFRSCSAKRQKSSHARIVRN
jgi:hypothetical protein